MSFVNSFTQNNQVGNIGSTGIMNNGPIGFQQSNINSFQNNPTSGFSSQPIYSGQSISSSQGLGSNYNQFQMGQNTQTYNNQGSNIQGSGWQTQPNLSQSSNLQRPSSNSGIPSCNPGEYWNGAKCTSSWSIYLDMILALHVFRSCSYIYNNKSGVYMPERRAWTP